MRRLAILTLVAAIACSPRVKAERPAGGSTPQVTAVASAGAGTTGKLWTEAAPPPSASLKNFEPTLSLAPLVKTLRPTVVNVQAMGSSAVSPMDEYFGLGRQRPQQQRRSQGSGFILTGDGIVITNNHVVQRAEKISVTLEDGREFQAKVLGTDPNTDVAVLRLENAKNLPSVVLGDSARLEVGDWVVAIGNPFGLGLTVTSGIVSAKERTIGAGQYDDFIQTDAAINPGNSGGPLFNLRGEVVGINSVIVNPSGSPSNIGIGFAIPINLAKTIVAQIRQRGKAVRGWLGIQIQNIDPKVAKTLGLPSADGALVSQVDPSGPAAKAGLKAGDVIVEVNGKRILHSNDLPKLVVEAGPGATAHLVTWREQSRRDITLTIGENPDDAAAGVESKAPVAGGGESVSGDPLGLKVASAPRGIPGVMVQGVSEKGPAVGHLQSGDIIRAINKQTVASVADYRRLVNGLRRGENVLMHLQRGPMSIVLVIPIL